MTPPENGLIAAAARRDRGVATVALAGVVALAWIFLLAGAGMDLSAVEMTRMSRPEWAAGGETPGMVMMIPASWTPGYAGLMFVMWSVMMVAMMLPSAAPMILFFDAINRTQRDAGQPHVATGIFAAGYLVAWSGFSLVAVSLQWGLQRAGLLSPMLVGTSRVFAAGLLVAAGIYQLTPLKHACLRQCRNPISFVATRWRSGMRGALRMGLEHGAVCVGCCWFLMGLLFVGGVMNLYWIGGLALFVLLEKTVPAGHWLGYAAGIALLVGGIWILAV